MVFSTNKERGNSGLAMAIAYFGCNGNTVSIPVNDTQDYDLVVDISGSLKKVQVKFTGFKSKADNYVVNLRSSGGTKGKVYSRVIDLNIDILFVVCSDKEMYLIPKEEIVATNSMVLNKKGQIRVNNQNTKDYSKYIVEL